MALETIPSSTSQINSLWKEIFEKYQITNNVIVGKIIKISSCIISLPKGEFLLKEFIAKREWDVESKTVSDDLELEIHVLVDKTSENLCDLVGNRILLSLKRDLLQLPRELCLSKEQVFEEFSRIGNVEDGDFKKIIQSRAFFVNEEGEKVFYDANIGTHISNLLGDVSMILAKAPTTEELVEQFCNLIWHNEIGLIITVADDNYLPFWPVVADSMSIGEKFKVTLQGKEEMAHSMKTEHAIWKRTLSLQNAGQERICTQLHLKKWKDMCACDPVLLQELVKMILQSNSSFLVHCEMGVGRTGVVALLIKICSSLIDQLEDGVPISKLEFGIAQHLYRMRTEIRHSLVLTKEQYYAVYKALKGLYPWLLDFVELSESQSKRLKKE
jgi:hypothetical protein